MTTPYHEPAEELTPETREIHRAIATLVEEMEAIDWYQQRIDATRDEALKAILAHNRDEETEHAAMTLEWLRRRHAMFAKRLRQYLFTEKPIHEIEDEEESSAPPPAKSAGSIGLGIGTLKG